MDIRRIRAPPTLAAIEIHCKEQPVKKILTLVFEAISHAREKRVRDRLIAQLDERTLRDIGLEHEANHRRERSRRAYMSFGAY
jgi:hypothetical protein